MSERNLFQKMTSIKKSVITMKKTIFTLGFMSLFILLTAMTCSKEENPSACEETQMELLQFQSDIRALANTSVCSEEYECRYIAFGSKACGGPWEFLTYTTSIDTLAFTSLVAEYNQLENNYNLNCNIVSDCSTPQPPIGFDCQNSQCIPIY